MNVHFAKYADKIFEYIKVNLANKEQFNGYFNGSTLRWFCISCYFSYFRKRMVKLLIISGCWIIRRRICLQSVSHVSALHNSSLLIFSQLTAQYKNPPDTRHLPIRMKGVRENLSQQKHSTYINEIVMNENKESSTINYKWKRYRPYFPHLLSVFFILYCVDSWRSTESGAECSVSMS